MRYHLPCVIFQKLLSLFCSLRIENTNIWQVTKRIWKRRWKIGKITYLYNSRIAIHRVVVNVITTFFNFVTDFHFAFWIFFINRIVWVILAKRGSIQFIRSIFGFEWQSTPEKKSFAKKFLRGYLKFGK